MKDSKRSLYAELIAKSGLDPEGGNFPFIMEDFTVLMDKKETIFRNNKDKENICYLRHVLMYNDIKYRAETDGYYTKFYLY